MKLAIYEEKKEEEKKVRLKLETTHENEVALRIVNKEGLYINTLLYITEDGRVERVKNIPHSLGFPLDDKGRIKLKGEEE